MQECEMSQETKKAMLLDKCVGQSQALARLVGYAADSIVSKTILDKPTGTLTLFAFDQGQKLSEHTSPYDATVQVIDGRARVTIAGQDTDVAAGQLIIMPAHVPHAVTAAEPFKMLLIMIRD
jgi:quercetin dioxygenase-like cupin family protein